MAEKIFLLEDDAYLRDGLLEMLQGRDYEVERNWCDLTVYVKTQR